MHKFNSRLMLTAVAAAALVAACGDGSGVADDPAAEVGQSVEKTINFIKNLIANNGENSDPIDVDPITLAVDDTVDPTSLD